MESKLHLTDLWTNNVIFPRMLDVLVRVLESFTEGTSLPPDLLETVLPDLCLALPHDSLGCSRLLAGLPESSSVWDKLEEGVANKKYLPVEITVTLYKRRSSTLEAAVLAVLGKYAEVVYEGDWSKDATLSIDHFKAHGVPLEDCSSLKRKRDRSSDSINEIGNVKTNLWGTRPVVLAAARCDSVFSQCLKFLCRVAVQSSFSVSFVLGGRDFFAELMDKLDGELYAMFPPSIQHLVYLLTLPISTCMGQKDLETYAKTNVVQNALLAALQGEGGEGREVMPTVRSLLCFFPFWLPILHQDQFLKKHLREYVCELPYT